MLLKKRNDRQFSLENSRLKMRKVFEKKTNVHLEGECNEIFFQMQKWTQIFV